MGQVAQKQSIASAKGVAVAISVEMIRERLRFGRHVAEVNATNHSLVRAYVWGLDLSETLDGAGGVGGLLWVRVGSGPAVGTHFVCYDGNGNVWNLVSATTGTETARYEYGPFGEPLRLSGPAARFNPFRFSTKRTEDFTGLVLYEYRAYSPSVGRWTSRDPLNELGLQHLRGGVKVLRLEEDNNQYRFGLNAPSGSYDPDGRAVVPAAPIVIVVAGSVVAEFAARLYCVCAFKPGQVAYVRTPVSVLAHFSGIITSIIETYCDGAGTVRLRLWKDQYGDCHDELVVICLKKSKEA